MTQSWRRRKVGGWITADGKWSIRGPIMGVTMWWLYRGNNRYSPTGKYDDAVNFSSVSSAKKFVDKLNKAEGK